MPKTSWQPSASIEMLKKRSTFVADIRRYFEAEGVTEVHTPTLMPHTVTCPQTEAFEVSVSDQPYFLQTSPEYALKRLLAAGMGDMYQLGPAYRNELIGRWHQIEFTMLEWYRVGWDDKQLMGDVAKLLQAVGVTEAPLTLTYQAAFLMHTGLDPLSLSGLECRSWLRVQAANVSEAVLALPLDALLQYVFATYVETCFDPKMPTFITEFPANQAALARLDSDNPAVARRFELYLGGLECANGFYELNDVDEQRNRFECDQKKRREQGLPKREIDPHFMQALGHGLPDCAGVALGVDRLLAALLESDSLAEVMAFPLASRAIS